MKIKSDKITSYLKAWFADHFDRFGNFLQGIGTLLVGLAALTALMQTQSTIEHILKIQETSNQINKAVKELETQTKSMNTAINLLQTKIAELWVKEKIQDTSLKERESSKDQIQKMIYSIPSHPEKNSNGFYIPENKKIETINRLYENKSPKEREKILRDAIKSDFILDESRLDEGTL